MADYYDVVTQGETAGDQRVTRYFVALVRPESTSPVVILADCGNLGYISSDRADAIVSALNAANGYTRPSETA